MLKGLSKHLVRPLAERLGTLLAGFLIAQGHDADLAAQLANALVVVSLVALDLFTAEVNKVKAEIEGGN